MVMEIIVSVVLLFVGIAVLVVIHVCIVSRVFSRNYEIGHANLVSRSVMKGMSRDDLKKLPSFDYKANELERGENGSSNTVDCIVCLEKFRVGDCCRVLPNCEHSFHAHCIDSWLLKSSVCPICRARVKLPKVAVAVAMPRGEETGVSGIDAVVELV